MAWYRKVMEMMAPDVIVLPIFRIKPEDQPAEVYRRLLPVAQEYARRMDWGWIQ